MKRMWFVCTLFILIHVLATPPAPTRAQDSTPSPDCISIVGDSIAAGTLVAQIPNTGFAVLQTTPIASVVRTVLIEQGLPNVAVYDRSLPAATLADASATPYRRSGVYAALLNDRCATVAVLPWNNDLKVQRPQAAAAHITDLVALVNDLQAARPDVHVLLFSHYWFTPQPFVEGLGIGLTHRNFVHHHAAFLEACTNGNVLAQTGAVTCINTQALLRTPDASPVVLVGLGPTFVNNLLAANAVPSGAELVQFYLSQNPNGTLVGDGVHLNGNGKRIIAGLAVGLHQQRPVTLSAPPTLRQFGSGG